MLTTGERPEGSVAAAAAALYLAVAYVVGVAYFVIGIDLPSVTQPLDKIALFSRHLVPLQLAHLAIYVVFGFVLMVLAWALHRRLAPAAPITMRVATTVALVWAGLLVATGMVTNAGMASAVERAATDAASAAQLWLTVETVTTGLGGGNGEVLGGLWTLLVSVTAWRSRTLPALLAAVGILAGAAGVASALPGLTILVAPFALFQLIWFVGLAVVLLRRPRLAPRVHRHV
jgi:hypothetical protein